MRVVVEAFLWFQGHGAVIVSPKYLLAVIRSSRSVLPSGGLPREPVKSAL